MSLRKIILLTRQLTCTTISIQCNNSTSIRKDIIASSILRNYSQDNIGNKNEQNKPGNLDGKPSIIGGFFSQNNLSATEAKDKLKEEQEKMEKESKQSQEENEKRWKRMKIGFAVFGAGLTVGTVSLVHQMGSPHRDEDGQIIMDEFTGRPVVMEYLGRAWKELTFYEKMMKEPIRDKLLPDILPAPYQPTYTLLLEFTDVLVHPDWTYETGWRFKKRPGVDAFLQAITQADFEVVIFTTENAMMIWPVIDKLDPENKMIAYRLFRDSTHFIDGAHVKNLEGLNRDLSKVIAVDWNAQSLKYHRENALVLKKWRGEDDDTQLLDLANLLQAISMSNVSDVREVLRYYSQFDDPIAAFRDNQRRLQEQMEQRERESKSGPTSLTSSWLKPFTRK